MIGGHFWREHSQENGVYLGVKTCEVFLCFLAIILLGSIVLTSQWLLCIHCFTSLESFIGFYTEDEPENESRTFISCILGKECTSV